MTEEKILEEEILNENELEQVVGGTFTANKYSEAEYNAAGITVNTHFFGEDEFTWRNKKYEYWHANAIVYYCKHHNSTQPKSFKAAWNYARAHWRDFYREKKTCFVGETKISTPNGEKFIKDIKIGDEVISLDAENNKVVSKVIEVIPVHYSEIVKVEFSNGKVWKTTESQWFYCGNDDYACVLDDQGKAAITEDGATATVIKAERTGKIKRVYDFVVENLNVFFVEGIASEGYSEE